MRYFRLSYMYEVRVRLFIYSFVPYILFIIFRREIIIFSPGLIVQIFCFHCFFFAPSHPHEIISGRSPVNSRRGTWEVHPLYFEFFARKCSNNLCLWLEFPGVSSNPYF